MNIAHGLLSEINDRTKIIELNGLLKNIECKGSGLETIYLTLFSHLLCQEEGKDTYMGPDVNSCGCRVCNVV